MVDETFSKLEAYTENVNAGEIVDNKASNEKEKTDEKDDKSVTTVKEDGSCDKPWNNGEKKAKRKSEDPISNGTKRAKNEEDDLNLMNADLFDWPSYLVETNSKAVPSSIFKHIVPECMCGFEPGMKLEVPNKDYKNTYWLATIVAKATPLILVRYEGFQDNNEEDFWCNTLSDDIHPVGWCAKSKHALKPPGAIQHKEQNWYSYLIRNLTGAKKASENLFLKKSHPAHYLRAGQYVEILDPYNPLCYWLARVNEVFQGRLNLQYEGWEGKAGEFWCFYLHENLRPVGHGIKNELTLYPPKGSGPFSPLQTNRLLEKVTSISKRIDNSIFSSLFMGWTEKCSHDLTVGMKLESVHPVDPTAIHVASVIRIFDEYYFLVQVDTLLSTQDDVTNSFVAHKYSSQIFPVGFCSKNGLAINQPSGYIGKFTWDAYLKYTKAEPVPEIFFPEVCLNKDIEVGMKLEAVDKENPRHICVSTVTKVVENHVWLHIDGDTRNEQIFSIDSSDIFPIGWCESTGHELQWPRPNTLEQKNRISSLRSTVSRQNRLEVLRKGKLREEVNDSAKDVKKDFTLKAKRKSKYLKGHRGHARKNRDYNDTESSSYADNTHPLVCISQLAKEFNTEECIKKSFGLDAKGRLPKEVVTIDDDDDDDDEDIPLVAFKQESKYNEKDISYLSYLRVKPKDLTKSENELFEKKVKENEGIRVADMDSLSSPSANREKRSLNTVVAMLRSTNKQSRTQLLEQYKQNKAKRQELNQNISEKENAVVDKRTSVIDLCDDNTDDSHLPHANKQSLLKQDGPINIPGKGEYRIVEKIVSKQGDKNKIILKLGKPPPSMPDVTTSLAQSSPQPTLHATTPPVHLTTTHVNDMHTISNMVRNQPGLNEIMKTRCHKVRALCKDLPKNPLLWTKRHVALFIQNADFKKYAKRFFDQEIDGHSLLLLTAWEIHNILGVQLGPAMKIHDYIFSLQQLVNDAYLKSKNDAQGGCTSQANNDSIILERDATESDLETESCENSEKDDESVKNKSNDVMKWLTETTLSTPAITDEMTVNYATATTTSVKNELYTQSASANITDDLALKTKPTFGVQPIIHADQQVRFIYQPIRPNMGEMNPGEYALVPTSEGMAPALIQYNSPYITPYKCIIRPPTHLIPIQYIQQPPPANEEVRITSHGESNTTVSIATPPPQVVMSCVPSPFKGAVDGVYQLPTPATVKNAKQKKPPDPVKMIDVKKSDQTILPTLLPSLPSENPEKYLRSIHVELESQDLWNAFHKLGTEMILTRAGRRMFPTLQVSITGMDPKSKYVILVDFAPSDHYRYKFEYESSSWLIACEETTPPPGRVYIHPESPANGDEWMRNIVDFTRCKLTNNLADCRGHILMHSMHKYQPRIHIIYWDGSLPLQINPFELLRLGCRREFVFTQTQFIAVTAYQNSQITHLKIESNPFARGFRGDWRKYSESVSKKSKYSSKVKEEPLSNSPDLSTMKDQLVTKVCKQEDAPKLPDTLDDTSDDNEEAEDKYNNKKIKEEPEKAEGESHASERMDTDNG